MDSDITRINALTAGRATAAMVPVSFETDRQVMEAAMSVIGLIDPPDSRFMWIRNTLDAREVECSEAYLDEASQRDDLEILSEPRPLPFDSDGNLPDYVAAH